MISANVRRFRVWTVLWLAALAAMASAAAVPEKKPVTPVAPVPVNPSAREGKQKAGAEKEIEALIAQALDEKTDLEVKNMPIREALQKLSKETGIPIEMEMHTVWLLPYGSQTLLTATIHDRPLRESLTAVLRPLGLDFVPERERVTVRPTPALRRLARRATWQELATLEMLSTPPWSKELFDSLKIQFQDSTADDLNVNRQTLWKLASAVGAGTAAEVLEHATDQYGWTWFPSGEGIVILSKTHQVERQLQRPVKVKYVQAGVRDVLLDLANWAGVLLRLDPGVLAALPAQSVERISLSMENATVQQALEVITGETGLGYFIEPNGIRITAATMPASSTSASDAEKTAQATYDKLRSNSIVGQITIPNADGTSVSLFLRETDLSPEVNELRKSRLREVDEVIRRTLTATSKPAS